MNGRDKPPTAEELGLPKMEWPPKAARLELDAPGPISTLRLRKEDATKLKKVFIPFTYKDVVFRAYRGLLEALESHFSLFLALTLR
jgi:hypothetical protein